MSFPPIPLLKTPRLILRPLVMEDELLIQHLFPQWNIVRYMRVTWPYPSDGAYAFLKKTLVEIEQRQEYGWAITLADDPLSTLIGTIGLYPAREEDHRGFWISEAHQNKGLMKEAVLAVTDFAFRGLGMPAMVLFNAEPNMPSHRIKEHSGAVIAGKDENIAYVEGIYRRVRWRLEADQWEKHRSYFIKQR